ncbi:MAG: hypothetical protein ABJB76_01445 [Candidatus Nitrosocosmicus sp.]
MSWTGKIVLGISLILLGLGGAGYGLLAYYSQIKNIQLCNSLPGAFNQLNANACNKISDFLITGIVFILVGTIMLIIGIILLRSSQKQKSK